MRVLRTNLTPGMTLERDAMDRTGRLLIGAETELTDRLVEVLKTAQIPVVYVTDKSFEEHDCVPDLPPLSREQQRDIDGRFRHVDLHGDFAREVFGECIIHSRERNALAAEAKE